MSEEETETQCECEEGLPAWMATFADMMALLMCFFVLLLSFAEMDAIRFKKMADSMKDAFGVQKEIPASEIVKGISAIKLEFSPSISEEAVVEEVKQQTTDEEKERLEVNDGPMTAGKESTNTVPIDQRVVDAVEEMLKAEAEDQAKELRKALKNEIDAGMVTIEVVGTNVIIRINEKGSFPSGSADLHPGFIDVLDRIAVAISVRPGKVVVAGHTDNIPINTTRFRSNWELSAARAVTVVHTLLTDPTLDPARFLLEGHADSAPLVPNDSSENRAINRRVELIIKRVKEEELEALTAAKAAAAAKNAAVVEAEITTPAIESILEGLESAESAINMATEGEQSEETAIDLTAETPQLEELLIDLAAEVEQPEEIKPAVEIPAPVAEPEDLLIPTAEIEQTNDVAPAITPEDDGQKGDIETNEKDNVEEVISVEELI